jgi:hypothetical protein
MMWVFWIVLYTGTPHIFGLPNTVIACVFVKQQTPKKRSNWRLYTRVRDPTGFMMSTCAKLFQWCWYSGFCSKQVPHTYSVSQLLSSHLYLPRNRHRKSAQKLVYTHGVDISLLLCCQRVPNCFNDESTLDCALHRYPTHIRSVNYCHRMCFCQGIGSEQSLKLSFIHTDSTFHFCNSVNVGSSASMMDVVVYYCHTGRARHASTVGMPKSWIVTRLICTITWIATRYICTQTLIFKTVYVYWNVECQRVIHTGSLFIPKASIATWHTCTQNWNYVSEHVCRTWIYARYTHTEILNFKGLCIRLVYTKNLNCKTLFLYRILEWSHGICIHRTCISRRYTCC